MRLVKPRIAPLGSDQLDAEQLRLLTGSSTASLYPAASVGQPSAQERDESERPLLNSMRTLGRIPEAYIWLDHWGAYVRANPDDLALRDRQVVLLRTVYLCKAGYAWGLHAQLSAKAGILSEAEIERIKSIDATAWEGADAALIQGVDELHADQFISEPTWIRLRDHFSEKQAMGIIFTAGQYTLISMTLNTLGVQLDDGIASDPDLER